ncbi:TPA: AAA family ATPase [Candidatus Woesearchaeota archaeon]|nr:AAA family ATPase [Candidatus Woesearchaeota archaeon]HIH31505.1 AAA family ATPase [Candidatus Woesearchaeota archaeon]HIH54182.1 AAA family ATPase [Candidatus Woesearchaeota archaeon]HIJ01126.1 AAA family ATPase [Candidatus Woesearchaeota archaeon]HIJ13894.1 AAA family ATPase [Candidatus Woesearchaeota archaeon]
MLIEFSIENFRSIKEKVTFSMIATKDISLDGNLIKDVLKEDTLLKSAVIYGANASGKTNVILALGFLKALVMNSHNHQKGQEIRFTPFKLDKKYLTKPTKMSIVFMKNEVKYHYEVSFDNEKVIEESLYYYPNNKKAVIFSRSDSKGFKFTIDEKEQKVISERTLPNVLYLSKSTQENYKKTAEAFDWFKDNLQVVGTTDHPALANFTIELMKKDAELKSYVLKALLEADVGIDDVSTISKKVSPEDLKNLPPEVIKLILGDKPEIEAYQIQTLHKGVVFDFQDEESEGTKRIFSLIGPWIDALKNGRILVVDEIDTKLHHLLNIFLIKLFHDPTQNKSNAQLIFTTHNTNLLDQDIFRRDQIWFTEKNPEKGSSDLYSLTEYSPRKDKDIEKGYLAGKYGALPFIKENRIF